MRKNLERWNLVGTQGCQTHRETTFVLRDKTKLIRATPLAAAKIGTPAAHVSNASFCAFRAAVVGAIEPKTSKRCPCRTFEFHSHGDDLDPDIVFSSEKFILFRRVFATDPELRSAVSDILQAYRDFGSVGIGSDHTDLTQLRPAPPPGHPDRHLWEPPDPELGPIGLILSTVHKAGAAMDIDTFIVHQQGEASASCLDIPYNHVKKVIGNFLIRARSGAAQGQRALNEDLDEIDIVVYRLVYAKLD